MTIDEIRAILKDGVTRSELDTLQQKTAVSNSLLAKAKPVDLEKGDNAIELSSFRLGPILQDDTNKVVTTVSAGNTKIGVATQPAASGDATVRVRLNGSF